MKNKIKFAMVLCLPVLLSAAASEAFARSRRGGGLGSALAAIKPKASMHKGQCNIKIDCPRYKITVDGEDAGQIICGRQTGANFANKTVTLASSITPAGGAILPRGFPMIATSPMLCSNCFIHVYPWVGPSSRSLGCVGVTNKAWEKITKCGGSKIDFVAMNGAKSKTAEVQAPAVAESRPQSSAGDGGGSFMFSSAGR